MNKAIFFDRDGVLNKLIYRDGGFYSPQKFSQFKIEKEAMKVTKTTKSLGFLNLVVSNQPDISRQKMNEADLGRMTNLLKKELTIDDVFYCKHDDIDNCKCRKPSSGLIIEASKKWNIDLKNSFLIGDNWKDIEAGKDINLKSFLLDKDYNEGFEFEDRLKNLSDLINLIRE
jgi:D-glycero-D-manno-heptose 1,7-bisphosphate phosphatase